VWLNLRSESLLDVVLGSIVCIGGDDIFMFEICQIGVVLTDKRWVLLDWA